MYSFTYCQPQYLLQEHPLVTPQQQQQPLSEAVAGGVLLKRCF